MSKHDSKSKSNWDYLHVKTAKEVKNGKVVIHEEEVKHKDGVLVFKLYKKSGDKIERYHGKMNADGTFTLTQGVKGDKESKTMSKTDLLKELKKHKDLEFAEKYLANLKQLSRLLHRPRSLPGSEEKPKRKSRGRKGSRKSSKKASRKGSKKSSKKASRKGSKKSSKKASRKGSKKSSRKGSKKSSKKASRKGSKKSSKKASRKGSKKSSKKRSRKGRK